MFAVYRGGKWVYTAFSHREARRYTAKYGGSLFPLRKSIMNGK